jgi:hypothetical protein
VRPRRRSIAPQPRYRGTLFDIASERGSTIVFPFRSRWRASSRRWRRRRAEAVGTFHKMSAKYMLLYVAEFQFRHNNRFDLDMFGTAIEGC